MSKFQVILTGVFGVFIVLGVIIFSAYEGSSGNAVPIVIWGTLPPSQFDSIVKETSLYQSDLYNIQYVEKSLENFDSAFVEALASGSGPDLFMLSSDKILTHRNKIFPIPYKVFTERQFKDSFIEGAEIYMVPEGLLALPVSVDPLVMYWNRSIFNETSETVPPKYWDEFYRLAQLLSIKDGSLNILRSAVALGEYANITHAKEIIINLTQQAGSPIVLWSGEEARTVFADSFSKPIIPAEAAVNFYSEFGNPAKSSYSWNRSLPNSRNYFLGGDLAIYFGFASEISLLQFQNPNLNFDVAAVPTSREGGENVSYARFEGIAVTEVSKNKNAAFAVASMLAGPEGSKAWSAAANLPSPRRDLLSERPTGAYESIFRESAIRGRGWLDPAPVQSDAVFKTMIESITSGRARVSEAVLRANEELRNLLQK